MPALIAIPLAVLAVLLTLLTLPVSLPLLSLLDWLESRRQRAAAGRTSCRRCGRVLGVEALDAADAVWSARHGRDAAGTRHSITRLVRRLTAICTGCGAGYFWDKRHRAFLDVV